jgi:two-component system response regulator AtoC
MSTILVVDDERSMLEVLSEMLVREGYAVETTADAQEAIALVQDGTIDLVISDLKMEPTDGLELLRRLKRVDPEIVVIVMTAYASYETAVEAMREGALEYVMKPFKKDEILLKVKLGLQQRAILDENRMLKREIAGRYQYENIVGTSKPMQAIYRLIEKVAPTDSTVLISGESGTGKELVARALHYNSPRRERPFCAVNCGALPETLLESELFGHVKGAFTGAHADKDGLFESANKGTILLDEIGTMSPTMQMKLLRVLQEREVKRVGSNEVKHIDVRVIAATNENLTECVKNGQFREDLYFRLSVIPIAIPPLRERREDVSLLVRHFLEKRYERFGVEVALDDEAMYVLENHDWPGNVRELENVIERAATLCEGNRIRLADLPERLLEGHDLSFVHDKTLKSITRDTQRRHIARVLRESGGDKKTAAKLLEISVPSLYRKIDELHLRDA